MTQYWFKPKRYGYGATPTTWQGWAAIIAIVLAMVAVSLAFRLTVRSYWGLAGLLTFDVVALAVLLFICRHKTDGELRRRWGND